MTNVPKKLTSHFIEKFVLKSVNLEKKQISVDGTTKFLLRLKDNSFIESVLIPEEKRVTICVSSQVGCKFNCSFCATGKLGYTRNLSVAEIVSQITFLQEFSDRRITNVVYMGMGEPFSAYFLRIGNNLSRGYFLLIGTIFERLLLFAECSDTAKRYLISSLINLFRPSM